MPGIGEYHGKGNKGIENNVRKHNEVDWLQQTECPKEVSRRSIWMQGCRLRHKLMIVMPSTFAKGNSVTHYAWDMNGASQTPLRHVTVQQHLQQFMPKASATHYTTQQDMLHHSISCHKSCHHATRAATSGKRLPHDQQILTTTPM